MGVANTRCAVAEDDGHPSVDRNAGLPYFFLASCPDEQLKRVIDLTERYGGFNSFSSNGQSTVTRVGGTQDEDFAAWKGRAEGQFSTLKRLSKPGQKVVGIAIAGFGRCNKEREFLSQLSKKKGNEQCELKQCGDVADMERWLESEGYRPVVMTSRLMGTAVGRTQVDGVWASMATMASMAFGDDAEAVRRERLLLDVERIVQESFEVDEKSEQSLRDAKEKLSLAIENSRDAGVLEQDVSVAETRRLELERLIKVRQQRKGFCGYLPLCCGQDIEWKSKGEMKLETQFEIPGKQTEAELQGDRLRALEVEVEERQRHVVEEKKRLLMQTVLPGDSNSVRLKVGTRCRYNSSSVSKCLPAVVQGYNASDDTYNLDVRPHASVENISPSPGVKASEAWPSGILVDYESSSAGHALEATILSYNEADGTYNLDVREHAECDRIKLRAAH